MLTKEERECSPATTLQHSVRPRRRGALLVVEGGVESGREVQRLGEGGVADAECVARGLWGEEDDDRGSIPFEVEYQSQ